VRYRFGSGHQSCLGDQLAQLVAVDVSKPDANPPMNAHVWGVEEDPRIGGDQRRLRGCAPLWARRTEAVIGARGSPMSGSRAK
jgi:hypothetical protein